MCDVHAVNEHLAHDREDAVLLHEAHATAHRRAAHPHLVHDNLAVAMRDELLVPQLHRHLEQVVRLVLATEVGVLGRAALGVLAREQQLACRLTIRELHTHMQQQQLAV
jgi:hypothetical protein